MRLSLRDGRLSARDKILAAALGLIRARGYAATTVDDLCTAAGVTKGAFFHHFKSKEELAVAAADHWSETTGAFFAGAPYHEPHDPLDRVLGYLDFRKAILTGRFLSLPVSSARWCRKPTRPTRPFAMPSTAQSAITPRRSKRTSKRRCCSIVWTPSWSAESLALHTQAVLQGAFILAKAKGGAAIAADSIDHLRRYVELLFKYSKRKGAQG